METIESQNESFTELETSTTPNKSPRSYLCNECGRTFQSMPGLVRHFRSHTNDKRYKCNICNLSFNEKGLYEGHFNSHGNLKSSRCHTCGKTYQYRSSMLGHLPGWSKNQEPNPSNVDEADECDICKCKFSRKDIIRDHQQGIHFKNAKYSCATCSKRFVWRSSLARHKASHK